MSSDFSKSQKLKIHNLLTVQITASITSSRRRKEALNMPNQHVHKHPLLLRVLLVASVKKPFEFKL